MSQCAFYPITVTFNVVELGENIVSVLIYVISRSLTSLSFLSLLKLKRQKKNYNNNINCFVAVMMISETWYKSFICESPSVNVKQVND